VLCARSSAAIIILYYYYKTFAVTVGPIEYHYSLSIFRVVIKRRRMIETYLKTRKSVTNSLQTSWTSCSMRESKVPIHNRGRTVVRGVFQYQFGKTIGCYVRYLYGYIRSSVFENSDANSGACFETFNYFTAANLLPGH